MYVIWVWYIAGFAGFLFTKTMQNKWHIPCILVYLYHYAIADSSWFMLTFPWVDDGFPVGGCLRRKLIGGFNPAEKSWQNSILSPRFGLKIRKQFETTTQKTLRLNWIELHLWHSSFFRLNTAAAKSTKYILSYKKRTTNRILKKNITNKKQSNNNRNQRFCTM